MESKPLLRHITDLQPGEHLGWLYESDAEHRAVLTPFLRRGLEQDEKVLYLVDADAGERVLNYLRDDGLEVESYLACSQLKILPASDTYLRDGVFDPEGMIDLLRWETEKALEEGYHALRVSGEMTWVLRGFPGGNRLVEYEAKLNDFIPGSGCLALCQYDRRRFSADLLLEILSTHPIAVIGTEVCDNFYYVPPAELQGPEAAAARLKHWLAYLTRWWQMAETLRESEARFRQLFDHANDAVFVHPPITGEKAERFLEVNEVACRRLGYSREELLRLTPLDIGDPALKEQFAAFRQKLLTDGSALFEAAHLTKDGRKIPVEINAHLFEFQGQPTVLSIARDISERKQVEAALAWEAGINAFIAELAPALLSSASLEDISHLVLAHARKLTGSKYGYCAYLEPETGYLVAPTLTREIWEACGVPGKNIIFKKFTGLWGWGLINRRAVLSNSPATDPRSTGTPPGHILIQRFLAIPAMVDDQLFGQIALANADRDYGERDLELMERLAALYAIAIQRKRDEENLKQANAQLKIMVQESQDRHRQITQLNEMVDLLQSCQTSEEAYTVMAEAVQKFFPAEAGAFYVLNSSKNLLEAVSAWGKPTPPEAVFAPEECWAIRRGRGHLVGERHTGLQCRHVSPAWSGGYLCLPMVAQGETLGTLHLRGNSSSEAVGGGMVPGPLTESQLRLATMVTENIGLSLANLKLRETLRSQAIRDPLTGLFNRRYLEETLERELMRLKRTGETLGVVMMDLDHFKQFNDTFGHEGGDVLLTALGNLLRSKVRGEDIVCRYGGEEFLLILPGASLKATVSRAESLRKGIRRLRVQHLGQFLGIITLSLGVALFPEHGGTKEAVIRAADAALYRAKREGRDRVAVA